LRELPAFLNKMPLIHPGQKMMPCFHWVFTSVAKESIPSQLLDGLSEISGPSERCRACSPR
jgi:hypothetical protein